MSIVDVDFRYVMRLVLIGTPKDGAQFCTNEPVLQWRKKIENDQWNSLIAEDNWTEWQDVRTEDE